MRRVFWSLGIASGILVLAAASLVLWWSHETAPPEDRASQPVYFTVEEGQTLTAIAEKLVEGRFLKASWPLRAVSWVWRTDSAFQAGTYEILPSMDVFQIHRLLTSGEQVKIRVTIPEGWTAAKMAHEFEARNIVKAEAFLEAVLHAPRLAEKYGIPTENMQGFLFPSTYFFSPGFPAEKIVSHMVDTFFSRLADLSPASRDLSGEERYRRLILASIVEREYRVAEEAPLIASVFANRIENRMVLASCATIEYIITEIQKKPHPKRIYFRDTAIDSPFNTYLKKGLPPSPISNPGSTAIQAAFEPPQTDFLYFVVKDTAQGTHTFSKNYRQHNTARDEYLNQFQTKS